MKRFLQYLVVFSFVFILWIPLLLTPLAYQHQRDKLKKSEKRDAEGALMMTKDITTWVKDVQIWYQDSHAFRSEMMGLYNGALWGLRVYANGYFGHDGEYISDKSVVRRIYPIEGYREESISKNLHDFKHWCDSNGEKCMFIILPAKDSIYPEIAPRWIQSANLYERTTRIIHMIESAGFGVYNVTPELKAYAGESAERLYIKYDNHWNFSGAYVAYKILLSYITEMTGGGLIVQSDSISLKSFKKYRYFTNKRYLGSILSEPHHILDKIELSPIRVIRNRQEQLASTPYVSLHETVETFKPEAGDGKYLFIRDSFLTEITPLLAHGFGHSVFLNHNPRKEGGNAPDAIEKYKPDYTFIILQESSMINYLRFGLSVK